MKSHYFKKINKWREISSSWMPLIMSAIFALLWTFTMLPNTLIVRNFCLVIGGILGIYLLLKNFNLMLSFQAVTLWLVLMLFGWLILHFLLIGSDSVDQLLELQSIWKRAALGALFAVGFGISAAQDKTSQAWGVMILGFVAPMLIYGLKYWLTFYGANFGISAPDFLRLYTESAPFYIPKISYIFFCLPAFAVALGQLANFKNSKMSHPYCLFLGYLFLVFGSVIIFWSMQAKNGMAYACFLVLIFVLINFRRMNVKQFILTCVIICSLSILVWSHVQKNESWLTITADLKAAESSSPESGDGAFVLGGPYPKNELGLTVRPENYVRFAWAFKAIELIGENPLGYGIVQNSFGRLMSLKWPTTGLAQSHSAWLDITLAIGIPGVLMLLLAAFLAIYNSRKISSPWRSFVPWFLGSTMLLMLTTEVGQKNYLETFVLMIVFCASLSFQPLLGDNREVDFS